MRYWWVNDYYWGYEPFINFGYGSLNRNKAMGLERLEKDDIFIKYRSSNNKGIIGIPIKTIYAIGKIQDNDIINFYAEEVQRRNVIIKKLENPLAIDDEEKKQINTIQDDCKHGLFNKFKFNKNNNVRNSFIFELYKPTFEFILAKVKKLNPDFDISFLGEAYIDTINEIVGPESQNKRSKDRSSFLKNINYEDENNIFPYDKTKQKKACQVHENIVGYIYDYLTERNISILEHEKSFKDFDLLAEHDNKYLLFEAKSINNDSLNNQMKKALGQILVYKHELEKHNKHISMFIAVNELDFDYSKFKEIFDKYDIKIIECPKDLNIIDEYLNQ